MKDQRFIIEMGMGTDLHGQDATKAATRAVMDALHHSSLAILSLPGLNRDMVRVQVTIGVPAPGEVKRETIAALLPIGQVSVNVVAGGLRVTGGDALIASAAVEVFLPPNPTGLRAVAE
ncbi:MAG: hypothetical protein CSA70_03230 [Rhodobacterales bacterium]|nr:MAG: hypothetical protein CSA70_03230 [Rhodobacterales bacterium]